MINKLKEVLEIAVADMDMSGDVESHSYHQGIADLLTGLLESTPFVSVVENKTDLDVEAYLEGIVEAVEQLVQLINR